MKQRVLSLDEAKSLLAKGDRISTLRDMGMHFHEVDYPRVAMVALLTKHQNAIELTGKVARGMGHGIAVFDEDGALFIKTDAAALRLFDMNLIKEDFINSPVVVKLQKIAKEIQLQKDNDAKALARIAKEREDAIAARAVKPKKKRTDYFVVWIEGLSLKGGEKICRLTATGYEITTKMTEAMRFKSQDLPKLKSYLERHGVADWVLSSGNTFVKTSYTNGNVFDSKTNAL